MTAFLEGLEFHAQNLGSMMERCGVDPARLAQDRLGLTMAAVVRACVACRCPELCQAWLESASGRDNAPPAFCPNAERFRSSGDVCDSLSAQAFTHPRGRAIPGQGRK
jgi:Family of unknown function (DUF6455)